MEAIAYYDPGADITCQHTAGSVGGRFVTWPVARNTGGPSGISDTGDGLLVVTTPAANVAVFGVTSHDVAANGRVNVMRGPKVVAVEAGGAIPIGSFVATDNAGRAVVATTGQLAAGRALTLGASAAQCAIALFDGQVLAP